MSSLNEVRFPPGLEDGIDKIFDGKEPAGRIKRAARVNALLDGREIVSPDDVSRSLVSEGVMETVEKWLSQTDEETIRSHTAAVLASRLFPAIVSPEEVKGVLVEGFSNEAIEAAMAYLSSLGIEMPVVSGCQNLCDPRDLAHLCRECSLKYGDSEPPEEMVPIPVKVIDADVTPEMLQGSVYMRYLVVNSILHYVNGGVLFIKDIDRLSDESAFVLSSALESGELVVPGPEGNIVQKCRFVLIGSVGEGGAINPLLYEHISMIVAAEGRDLAAIAVSAASEISSMESDANRLKNARNWVDKVTVGDSELDLITRVCYRIGTKGNTAEIILESIARSIAALNGRRHVYEDDIIAAVRLGLPVIEAEAEAEDAIGEMDRETVMEART